MDIDKLIQQINEMQFDGDGWTRLRGILKVLAVQLDQVETVIDEWSADESESEKDE